MNKELKPSELFEGENSGLKKAFDEASFEDVEIYCRSCGGCGEVGCDGIEGFLNKHVKGQTDCFYEESYIRDIIDTYKESNA